MKNESSKKGIVWYPYNEGLISGAIKGLGKLVAKGAKSAGKSVAKGVKTAAKKAAPALKKAGKEALKVGKEAVKDAAKDAAKDMAKGAVSAGVDAAKDAAAKLSDAALKKIAEFSPETAKFIEDNGKKALDYMASKGMSGDALTEYANKFIDKTIDGGASEQDVGTLNALKEQIGNTQDDDGKMALLIQFVDSAVSAAKNGGDNQNGNGDGSNNGGNDNNNSNGNGDQNNNGGDNNQGGDNGGSNNNQNNNNGQQANESVKLSITKDRFNSSRYFQKKYGSLKYMSESGNLYKTTKGRILQFS